MKNSVKISELRKADIIVSTTGAAVSGVIRFGSGSDVSHSMLYTGNNWVIEAIAEGVKERPWAKASADATLAIALRRREMNDGLRDAVVTNAFSFRDRPYDAVGAAGAGLYKKRGAVIAAGLTAYGCSIIPFCGVVTFARASADAAILNNARDANKDKAFFCSELVARSYELAGVPISDGVKPTFMNPREVRVSSKLIYIGHLIG